MIVRNALAPLLMLLLLAAGPPAALASVEIKGVRFDNPLTVEARTYRLIGHGLFRYLMWDAYVGAYYQAEGYPRPAPQADVPRRLELEYFHDIEAADFAEVTRDTLRDQLGAERFRELLPALTTFNRAYRDVEPGDRYALHWTGERLTLSLNGEMLFDGDNLALANALFGIWLGDAPLGEGFRDALLGR